MTTGIRNSAENVVKRVARLTSGVSSKLDKAKAIDKGTRMDIAGKVKKMKEVVDHFDKYASERLKGLEERDKKRLEREAAAKGKARRKDRPKPRAPKKSSRPQTTEAPVVVYAPRSHIETPVRAPPAEPSLSPQNRPPPPQHASLRAPPQPGLIVPRNIAPPTPPPSPGTASKMLSFLPA